MLDMLCLTGYGAWGRLSIASGEPTAGRRLRIALFLREHAEAWQTLRIADEGQRQALEHGLDETERSVLSVLRSRGASFIRDLGRSSGGGEGPLLKGTVPLAPARCALRGDC